jgi:hypothetical protein
VQSLVVSGSNVYAAGFFTSIGGQIRNHIGAVDVSTGLATAWNPWASNRVFTLAVKDSTVYAGGEFTSIGGQNRSRIAALNATTGLATAWNPGADSYVDAIAVVGSTVYVGGRYSAIGGEDRSYAAALNASTGLTTPWDPKANARVATLAVSGQTVYACGAFTHIGGQSAQGFAALRPDSSAPGLLVLSPNGSSPLLIGTQRHLDWSAIDDLGVESVDLYLSRTGPIGPWELIAAAAPNNGSYLWNVTGPEVADNDGFLLIAARDFRGRLGTDISNSGFAISSTVVDGRRDNGDAEFALSSPSPNPTIDRSLLRYVVPARAYVRLSLFDVRGREVTVLVDGVLEAGPHAASIEAGGLSAGMYFAHLEAGEAKATRRVMIVK